MRNQKFELEKQQILPGFEAGQYVPDMYFDRKELATRPFGDNLRRDNRINIRISAKDLSEIQRRALTEGIPYLALVASIIHKYVNGDSEVA